MVSIQYIFQIFKKNLNFLTVHLERFCDNKNLFFENGRQKINLIITFLKNEKIWILKMLYGKRLLDFWNTCTFFKIFFTCQLATFLILSQSAWFIRKLVSYSKEIDRMYLHLHFFKNSNLIFWCKENDLMKLVAK